MLYVILHQDVRLQWYFYVLLIFLRALKATDLDLPLSTCCHVLCSVVFVASNPILFEASHGRLNFVRGAHTYARSKKISLPFRYPKEIGSSSFSYVAVKI